MKEEGDFSTSCGRRVLFDLRLSTKIRTKGHGSPRPVLSLRYGPSGVEYRTRGGACGAGPTAWRGALGLRRADPRPLELAGLQAGHGRPAPTGPRRLGGVDLLLGARRGPAAPRRLAAYRLLAAYDSNQAGHVAAITGDDEAGTERRELGDASKLVDTALGYLLGSEQTITIAGAEHADDEPTDEAAMAG